MHPSRSRRRAPRPSTLRPPLFNGYPYLVTRIGHSALRHVALLAADRTTDELRALARRQVLANRLDTCLVLGPDRCIYFSPDGPQLPSELPPSGGLLLPDRLRLAEAPPSSPELEQRRAALRAVIEARKASGYVVGDGLEGGRPATPDDVARLRGRDEAGLPRGLVRCPGCGQLRGECLDSPGGRAGGARTEVLTVRCRCDNHNRCARCGDPLAEWRLSAYHYDERHGKTCYLAAYCAFSHRCPDDPPDGSAPELSRPA